MPSYKSMARRLEALEAEANRKEAARVAALSDEELERAIDGKLSIEEIRLRYRELKN